MPKIKKLSPHIVSQISAGEVIERPAYAVKELIENAIDAKADSISVSIEESGLKNITVSDNGNGMTKEDLLLSFKPHTTSKLLKEEDLHAISSLGFRGEALSSIAAIADITIQSKYKHSLLLRSKKELSGYKVEIRKGVIVYESPIGMPSGTLISVSNIFANVPARKKFLKSAKTEFRHIIDIVSNFALAYPSIEFSLRHNDKEYFQFTKNHTLDRRIQSLLGDSLFVNLLPLSFEESYTKISGFIARPQYSIKGTSKIFIFVNGRRVYDSLVALGVKDAYKNLLEYGAYPIALLYIQLPFEMVDVNIHPRKEQVNFLDKESLYSIVSAAISETLKDKNLTFLNVSWKDGGTKTHLGRLLKYELMQEVDQVKKESDIMQLHSIYLVIETKKGVMIIDQHAAHEAILFRRLKKLYEKHVNKKEQYELQKPLLLDLSLSDKEILLENLTLFENLGFEIEEFGGSLRINKVPIIFKDRNLEDFIIEILEDIREGLPIKDIDKRTYRMISYLACRTAIKGGEVLTKEKMRDLINELQKEDMVYTCPHGRPVKVELTLSYLDRMFKRK